ncbi:hypothetical protein [Gilvimarinus xylanilyticus]|uniref:RND efflux pump membrane fusion protein barrel-sandwich domain-containing protein n=1 Tax=Gilvimarinus xylanilyticus TaxID=2944139 RepID=A0A9X2HVP5_9GAMM|nr:hypothetical protein [Gilvimarinus xylanilyticus]MCP8899283.1 hypothetical protein [Gilvimarinus xylanilyticus]
MKSLRTATSIATLLALGVLTACSEQNETSSVEQAQETVEKEVVEPTAQAVEEAEAAVAQAAAEVEAEMEEAEAEMDAAYGEKPFIVLTEEAELSATVVSIDQESREVTLATADQEMTLVIGEQVQNLDQVQKGDEVLAAYTEQLTLELIDGEGLDAGEGLLEIAERAEQGQLPGMLAGKTQVRVFMVEAIDLEDNTFKLRNVEGQVREFVARNPANLKAAQVGDALVATISSMVAVEVVHPE